MSKLSVRGIPSGFVTHIRNGGGDANGQPAITEIAHGTGNPCRHCLQPIAAGEEKLVLAYRPFTSLQPYAECGPIFLHKAECPHYVSDQLPPWFHYMSPALIRGYGSDDWIRYETGAVVNGPELSTECERILNNPQVAYIHIRSKFNCFQCRVERA